MADPFIKEHIEELLCNIRTEVRKWKKREGGEGYGYEYVNDTGSSPSNDSIYSCSLVLPCQITQSRRGSCQETSC